MSKKTAVMCLFVLLAAAAVPAQEKDEDYPLPDAGSIGFIFNFSGFPVDLGAYDDGMRTGVGMKYLISDKLRMRALVSATIIAQGDDISSLGILGKVLVKQTDEIAVDHLETLMEPSTFLINIDETGRDVGFIHDVVFLSWRDTFGLFGRSFEAWGRAVACCGP